MSPQVGYLSTAPTPAKISTKTAADRLTDAEASEVFRLAADRLIEEGFEASHQVLPGQPWVAVFRLAWQHVDSCNEGWE